MGINFYHFLHTHLSIILLRKHGLISKNTSEKYCQIVILFLRLFCPISISINYTWGVAARINQLGLKLKGKNGEKISIISTMGNGQDWVRTAASFGGETGTSPQAGAILSFAGGGHGTPAEYGHVAFVEKVYPDGSFLISETNYNGNPNYTFRRISGVDSSLSFAYTTK